MSQNKVSKTERLLNLISFMLRSRRPVPFAKIAGHVVGYDDEARLDSIEKRFDRDKAELRNMGIPVEYVDGGSPEASGYVIPRDRFFLREIELDRLDTLILSLAGRSGPVTVGSPLIKEAFSSALRKLAVDAPLTEAEAPAVRASLLQVSSGHAKVTEILRRSARRFTRDGRSPFRTRAAATVGPRSVASIPTVSASIAASGTSRVAVTIATTSACSGSPGSAETSASPALRTRRTSSRSRPASASSSTFSARIGTTAVESPPGSSSNCPAIWRCGSAISRVCDSSSWREAPTRRPSARGSR